MKRYGLLGFPISHSLSPYMHNAAFKEIKIDAQYSLYERPAAEVSDFVKTLVASGISGINVTIPYKEIVIPLLDSVSQEAKEIGAVNTIRVSDAGTLEGFNTDGAGFLTHLREEVGFEPSGARVAMVGCGGAARAIAVYLARCRPQRIALWDVDVTKREALVKHLAQLFPAVNFLSATSVEALQVESADLCVNATPLGMREDDVLPVPERSLHRDLVVYDLIYNPRETIFLAKARQHGARTSNGLGMLLYQGMSAFELWTGAVAPKECMRQALISALGH